MERNANIISTWEVVEMEERTMESNFMRLAHCVKYGTCRDWLSSENTGLRSPWHYSKYVFWRDTCVENAINDSAGAPIGTNRKYKNNGRF